MELNPVRCYSLLSMDAIKKTDAGDRYKHPRLLSALNRAAEGGIQRLSDIGDL